MAKLSDELLGLLRCPVTGSTLVQEDNELLTTVPGPAGVPLRYAIDEGIPLLLRPEQLAS
ncbi:MULTISPECIES: hypothetical protein [unclassified Arthrobacter]|uniref:hypothetical protein n=1 Tax=unclassified Arthrobacter TaxID=235627 RepID=UPI00159EB635|nr:MULTISPECIES: hypothetical protein [unclassified Arthrobacter]MCQ9163575.1 hypothetical protein [Arthrobacter sp. STN4]NVM99315.1 hypothetical protein [Arthrobacter sp. SDTb3-6]